MDKKRIVLIVGGFLGLLAAMCPRIPLRIACDGLVELDGMCDQLSVR